MICVCALAANCAAEVDPQPFGPRFSKLDSDATGEWWKGQGKKKPRLMVPRDQVLAFAVYTHDRGMLKLTAQLYPLMP